MDYDTSNIDSPKNETRLKQKPVVRSSRTSDIPDGGDPAMGNTDVPTQFKNLTLSQLDQRHVDYQNNLDSWLTILALRAGFPAIKANADYFLPKRPVEDDELYKLRLAKLVYSPVMSHVVHTYCGKMAESGIDFPEELQTAYSDIRKNNAAEDCPNRDEQSFISEIFAELLYFGRCHVLVDVPESASESRSAYELRRSKLLPFFSIIPVNEIIQWGDDWLIRKQFITEAPPFQALQTIARYTYMAKGQSVVYEIPVQTCKAGNDGVQDIRIAKVYHKGEWVVPDDSIKYNPISKSPVGYERIVSSVLTDDQWLCMSLFNKQVQHLRIENAWTDAGYLSGTVQRVFTPMDPAVSDDPRVTYDTGAVEEQLKKAGNAHILVGKGYSFVESSGTALANLEAMLDKIEQQISKIANLHFASGKTGALQQSGVSKQLDQSLLEGVMLEYGSVLIDFYNSVLAKVSELILLPPVEVGGLSDFKTNDINDTINTITAISTLVDFPPTAKGAIYQKLIEDLDMTIEDSDRLKIDTEIAGIQPFQPPTPTVSSFP